MIEVLLNKPEFEYDIHSLIKAFFPEQYVGVSAEKKEYDEKIDIRMQVNYGEDTIQITWQEIMHANEDAQANEKPGQEEVKEIPGETIQVDFSDRVRTKNQLKQMLYRMLCDYTKRTLPWGNLTGIRPTKIPMKLLEEGKSREEIYRYMKDTYLASDEKIELATDIAERENAILKKIDYDNGYSLYIGIPFCPTTCLYCSFTSYPLVSWKNRVDAYLDALEKEIDYTAAKFFTILTLIRMAVFVLLCFVYYPMYHHCYSYSVGGKQIRVSRGVVYSQTDVVYVRNLQYTTLSQTPLQRLMDLATLRLHAAGGGVQLYCIPYEEARLLRIQLGKKMEVEYAAGDDH